MSATFAVTSKAAAGLPSASQLGSGLAIVGGKLTGTINDRLKNGDFEAQLADWTINDGTVAIDSSNQYAGSYCLKLTGNGVGYANASQNIVIRPGDVVRLRAWVKNTTNAAATGQVIFADKNLTLQAYQNVAIPVSSSYTLVEVVAGPAPAGASPSAFAKIIPAFLDPAVNTSGALYIDNVTVDFITAVTAINASLGTVTVGQANGKTDKFGGQTFHVDYSWTGTTQSEQCAYARFKVRWTTETKYRPVGDWAVSAGSASTDDWARPQVDTALEWILVPVSKDGVEGTATSGSVTITAQGVGFLDMGQANTATLETTLSASGGKLIITGKSLTDGKIQDLGITVDSIFYNGTISSLKLQNISGKTLTLDWNTVTTTISNAAIAGGAGTFYAGLAITQNSDGTKFYAQPNQFGMKGYKSSLQDVMWCYFNPSTWQMSLCLANAGGTMAVDFLTGGQSALYPARYNFYSRTGGDLLKITEGAVTFGSGQSLISGAAVGQSVTISYRKAGGTSDGTLTFTNGILTAYT